MARTIELKETVEVAATCRRDGVVEVGEKEAGTLELALELHTNPERQKVTLKATAPKDVAALDGLLAQVRKDREVRLLCSVSKKNVLEAKCLLLGQWKLTVTEVA